jgi:murein DD-endopeptidase MepM/ murein hydrolase activator NlpD
MRSGTVSAVYEDGLMGITVVIDHGDGLTSTYCNLADRPTVQAGDKVQTGTVIGAVGDSAIAERGVSDHLHLETAMAGQSVDPREFLPEL